VEWNAADFMRPQNKVSKTSVGFQKKIFAQLVIKLSLLGRYAGMEVILLPQSVTNISLSECRLIYEGRQCSLQTARRYVPGVINLRSQRWAIHVNRPV
jgi:hypothetical protein